MDGYFTALIPYTIQNTCHCIMTHQMLYMSVFLFLRSWSGNHAQTKHFPFIVCHES